MAEDTQQLLKWARDNDRVLPDSIRERQQTAGMEHEVWFEDGRVWKAAVSPQTVGFADDGSLTLVLETSVSGYLERIRRQNEIFDDGIRVEGVVITDADWKIPIISQPIVEGEHPSLDQIAEYMQAKNFVAVAPQIKGWYSAANQVLAADAHSGNLVITEKGFTAFDLIMTSDPKVLSYVAEVAFRRNLEEADDDEL